MKAVLFYHSNSGHTRWVCEYLCQQIPAVDWTLADMRQPAPPDLSNYSAAGFATWTYYMGIPPLVLDFIQSLPQQNQRPAFGLTTFGMMPGQGLKTLKQALQKRGFMLFDAFSLHTPENYPPFVLKGQDWQSPNAPEPQALLQFQQFIARLQPQLLNPWPEKRPLKIGFWNSLMRPASLQKVQRDMGSLQLDPALCSGCGACQAACDYDAVQMNDSTPQFNAAACRACWNCFNHCPQKAIFTARVSAAGQAVGPRAEFLQKLPLNSPA